MPTLHGGARHLGPQLSPLSLWLQGTWCHASLSLRSPTHDRIIYPQICRFCWHHIKEDLNKRCPGCRKEYDDSVVEFKPMKADECVAEGSRLPELPTLSRLLHTQIEATTTGQEAT